VLVPLYPNRCPAVAPVRRIATAIASYTRGSDVIVVLAVKESRGEQENVAMRNVDRVVLEQQG